MCFCSRTKWKIDDYTQCNYFLFHLSFIMLFYFLLVKGWCRASLYSIIKGFLCVVLALTVFVLVSSINIDRDLSSLTVSTWILAGFCCGSERWYVRAAVWSPQIFWTVSQQLVSMCGAYVFVYTHVTNCTCLINQPLTLRFHPHHLVVRPEPWFYYFILSHRMLRLFD